MLATRPSRIGVPLEYHECDAGHVLDRPMVDDFQRWLAARIEQQTR